MDGSTVVLSECGCPVKSQNVPGCILALGSGLRTAPPVSVRVRVSFSVTVLCLVLTAMEYGGV